MSAVPSTICFMYHPWRELRDRGDTVVLHFTTFTDGRVAATNGSNAIWIDQSLQQTARRCAIAHEQAHIDLGHTDCTDPKQESSARQYAAQRLIDWDDLVDAFRWSHTVIEAADELWVTPEVFKDRLEHLTPIEGALLAHITATR